MKEWVWENDEGGGGSEIFTPVCQDRLILEGSFDMNPQKRCMVVTS